MLIVNIFSDTRLFFNLLLKESKYRQKAAASRVQYSTKQNKIPQYVNGNNLR